MNIILDSNILFSALIKDSLTRKIILEYEETFLFPAFIFEELKKHKQELIGKSGVEDEEFNELLDILLKKLTIVPAEALIKHREDAVRIIGKIDLDDAVFIACTLAYEDSILWSDDKRLKLQTKVKVYNTAEVKQMLNF